MAEDIIVNLPTYEQVEQVKQTVENIVPYGYEVFAVGMDTFIVPENVRRVYVTAISGGGGGGSGGATTGNSIGQMYGGSPGSVGMYCYRLPIDVISNEEILVSVGTKGIGGDGVTAVSNGRPGTNGGVTSFGDYLTLEGGKRGNGGGGVSTGSATPAPASGSAVSFSRKLNGETKTGVLNQSANKKTSIKEGGVYIGVTGPGNPANNTPLENAQNFTYDDDLIIFISTFGDVPFKLYGNAGRGSAANWGSSSANSQKGGDGVEGILIVEWGL